jgi:hypothetical protein
MTGRVAMSLAVVLCASAASAQKREQARYEWPARLAGATRDTLTSLADSARAARLPAEALVAKAAEGVLKGADDVRILRAVRVLTRELADARGALPSNAPLGTLTAAASALHAGVSPEMLRRLSAAGGVDAAELGIAFVTLADLVASRVPADAASASIEQLLRHRAPESEMSAFRAAIAQDIQAGRAPEAALASRTQALVRTLDGRPEIAPRRPPPN